MAVALPAGEQVYCLNLDQDWLDMFKLTNFYNTKWLSLKMSPNQFHRKLFQSVKASDLDFKKLFFQSSH